MQTLSYGYKKPQAADTGDVFYPAMSSNMDLINNHSHDGSTSAPLSASNQTIQNSSWVSVGGSPGIYEQTFSLAVGFNAYQIDIWFFDSNNNSVHLEYVVASSSSITVYTNNSSETYTAYYK